MIKERQKTSPKKENTAYTKNSGINAIEEKLQALWAETLGVSHVSREKDFYSNGGNSILSIVLVSKINKAFNTQHPICWLLENSTLEQQRKALAERKPVYYQPLVKFRENDQYPPLIFVHPSLIGAEIYHNFSNLLDSRLSFYGVENYNLNSHQAPINSYQALAKRYNQFISGEIKEPFFLGGYCYGAVLALEMAVQCAKKDLPLSTVYLIDPLLMYGERPEDYQTEDLLKLAGYAKLPDGKIVPEVSNDYLSKLLSSGVLDRKMIYNYSQSVPHYPHRVLLFLARKRPGKNITYEEELNFWKERLPRAEVITFDANHTELLNNECLTEIARKIQNDIINQRASKPIKKIRPRSSGLLKKIGTEIDDMIKEGLFIRLFEEKLLDLYKEGKLHGTVHTCVGQELSAIAVIRNLKPEDHVFSNHRGHGHFLAFQFNPRGLLAEILGKHTGICGGIGGSQHLHVPHFYTTGIQGGMLPIAAGVAFRCKRLADNSLVTLFIGDGTLGQGVVYETLNLASKWSLPLLIVVENNRYAQSTSITQTLAGSIAGRARAFGLAYRECDVWDLNTLLEETQEAGKYVRTQQAPLLLEIHLHRINPHSKGDENRDPALIDSYKQQDGQY